MSFLGFCRSGVLSTKRKLYWEIQIFSKVRDFSDGISLFNFKINWDRYEDSHSPKFEIELDFLNIHNHLWIYKF
jgi:hypothetical protein